MKTTGDSGIARSAGRLAGVDLLRGLCVLTVVIHHIHLRFLLKGYPVDVLVPQASNVLFWSGYYAVIVFFTISGFLITGLSIRRWGSLGTVQISRFYTMRCARIAPCLLLLLALLSLLHSGGMADFTIKPERASLGRALLAALTFHVNWLEGHRGYLPGGWDVLWSLSVEETFYIVFPLICVCLRSERLLLVALLGLIVAGPISRTVLLDQDPWGTYAYLSCMDAIAFGCIAALVTARLPLSTRTRRFALIIGTAMVLVVVTVYNENAPSRLASLGLNVSVLEAGAAMILVALGQGGGTHEVAKSTRWLRIIGCSSYEIYLFHMLVVLGLMALFSHLGLSGATIPVWYVLSMVLSVLLGCAISRWYSEPLNEWIRARYLPVRPLACKAVTD